MLSYNTQVGAGISSWPWSGNGAGIGRCLEGNFRKMWSSLPFDRRGHAIRFFYSEINSPVLSSSSAVDPGQKEFDSDDMVHSRMARDKETINGYVKSPQSNP